MVVRTVEGVRSGRRGRRRRAALRKGGQRGIQVPTPARADAAFIGPRPHCFSHIVELAREQSQGVIEFARDIRIEPRREKPRREERCDWLAV